MSREFSWTQAIRPLSVPFCVIRGKEKNSNVTPTNGKFAAMHEASLVEALLDEVARSIQRWSKRVELSATDAATDAATDVATDANCSDREQDTSHDSGLDRVTLVTIEIGPLSGVEAELVQLAFDRLAHPRGLTRAALAIDKLPLTIRCQSCGVATDQLTATFRCPDCGGGRVTVERGDSVILKSIELLDE